MPSSSRRVSRTFLHTRASRLVASALLGAQGLCMGPAALAAEPTPVVSLVVAKPAQRSDMDEYLFKQSLAAEMLATRGDFRNASQIYLDAARRLDNQQLFQRSVDLAVRGGLGEQALTSAKAWRQALPHSREASEYTAQILLAMGRGIELAPTLRTLIQLSPTPSQPQVMLGLPRSVSRLQDKTLAARVIDDATQPWREAPLEIAEAWLASAEIWMLAKDGNTSMASLKRAEAIKPEHQHVGLIAIDLMGLHPDAETVVQRQLARPDAPLNVRLAFGRKLAASQRYAEAAPLLQQVVDAQPEVWSHRITLAAVQLELKQHLAAETTLQPLLKQAEAQAAAKAPQPPEAKTETPAAATDAPPEFEQGYLLMAQVSEQKQKLADAVAWLQKADPKQEKLSIQGQRARLLVKQGQLVQARALIQGLPESEPRDAVAKAQAEAQILRESRQWDEAYKVIGKAVQRFPEDSDLLYDQAMLAERLRHYDDMEKMLREVMRMAPDNANAYNALGYSLADRGVRMDEARQLIQKALAFKPGDPFITDSLGWLEYRAGNKDEAVRLLKEAYQSRPDPEIGAHLGELLWIQGQRDAAGQIWRDSLRADPDNEALKDTLQRFKFKP
jgi:tetratricopeptide (TPR) repeat protein